MSESIKKTARRGFKLAFGAAKTAGKAVGEGARVVGKAVGEGARATAGLAGEAKDSVVDLGRAAAHGAGERAEDVRLLKLTKLLEKADRRLAEFASVITIMAVVGLPDQEREDADAERDGFIATLNGVRDRMRGSDDPGLYVTTLEDNLIPGIEDTTAKYRTMAKNKPLTVQSNGAPVTVFWTDIPGYADMNAVERVAMEKMAAEKIQGGKALFDQLSDPNTDLGTLPPATLKDVTNLVWAFKTGAQAKGSPYEKGALTVPNGDRLRDYLDTCTDEVYPRVSSHLPEKAKLPGQSARGMDFYGGDPKTNPDELLPSGMNTVLYQMVATPGGENRLYVKMETEGMWWSGSGNIKTDPTAPDPRPRRLRDAGNSAAHIKNYLKVELLKIHTQDEDLDAYRENTSKSLEKKAKALVDLAPRGIRATLKLALGKHLRVNFFLPALDAAMDGIDHSPDTEPFFDAYNEFFAEVVTEFGGVPDDDTFGGEIVLDEHLA